ncbi:MAG TPA: hypothetical protein VMS22_24705 [Candidatus Eisenbacteria bacterium]|nr:hypothetical protein [Candidatus Eisenbacteria bacterium]
MMRVMALPPCGLYRTTRDLEQHVPAGRLVYFHNHGNPGPGVYLPSGWTLNRAQWHERGHTIPSPEWAASLVPLPLEGLYRVRDAFVCCEKRCRTYEPDLLVQLGYNAEAEPLLFLPEWTPSGLAIPEMGAPIDAERIACLVPLKVTAGEPADGPSH